ncbi:MAG: Glu/Leu/Phe/Val dehydrogenase [Melioribacteraceae bacterium]|nr:Glu/Leu/Phe/Val dehydrogenase [Melioribacteraceae bacterium]
MTSNIYNPFKTAQIQCEKISSLLELNKSGTNYLSNISREFHLNIPVKMDDGNISVFKGYRVQHNNSLGPFIGGVRFHPQESVDILRAMAMWMTWQCAVMNLPLGGSNGGVICDPHDLSLGEQEKICRGYIRQLADNIGPDKDILAPDIMTSPQHMIWMLDEYEMIFRKKIPGTITGKPVKIGGSLGRKEATGYGVIIALREALSELDIESENTTASVQGFGSVAQNAIQLYNQIGGVVKSVACWDQADQKSYTYFKAEGINLNELQSISDMFGGIEKDKAQDLNYKLLSGEEWLTQNVDILIPAAIENQITKENFETISKSVKIIVEGANGPIDIEAEQNLIEKEITILPDIISNAGGVIANYYEQVQGMSNYYWEKNEVLSKLDLKITNSFNDVMDISKRMKLSLRDSAYLYSINNVHEASVQRGWI